MLMLKDLALRSDFQLGELQISPARRLLKGPSGTRHIEPLAMQVLLLLVDADGQVVTRTTLFDACWGGAMVGDDSLNRAIAKLRRTLEEIAPGLIEIETIPRTGYRLTGIAIGAGTDEVIPPSPAPAGVSRRTIVAGALAAAGLLGTAVVVGFVDFRNRSRADELVAGADQILRFDVPGTWNSGVDLLQAARRIEPDDARINGLLAFALASLGDDGAISPQQLSEAESLIRGALRSNPRESNALLARAMLEKSLRAYGDTDERLHNVLRIDPSNTFAIGRLVLLLQAAGLNQESWNWNERAIAIDPLSPVHQFRKGLKYWIRGDTRDADIQIDRLMQLWPEHEYVWNARFLIYAFTDRENAALAMLDDEQRRPQGIPPAALATWRAALTALRDRTPAVIAAAREETVAAARKAPGLAAQGAMILSALGELDAAFSIVNGFLLNRGSIITATRAGGLGWVNDTTWRETQWMFTPACAAMRADSRFDKLCADLGLADYWHSRGVVPDYKLRRP